MLPIDRTAVLLLAAGFSDRFGEGDKLLAPLSGKPLVSHAAALAAALPFADCLAVVPEESGPLAHLLAGHGLRLVRNPNAAAGRESSLRLGLHAALEENPAAVLILLGDMPFVTPEHIERLHAEAGEGRGAISFDGRARMPPALIPDGLARSVLALERTTMKEALTDAAEVIAPEALLRDFDTQGDFERAGR